jgi:hypothetical protein
MSPPSIMNRFLHPSSGVWTVLVFRLDNNSLFTSSSKDIISEDDFSTKISTTLNE